MLVEHQIVEFVGFDEFRFGELMTEKIAIFLYHKTFDWKVFVKNTGILDNLDNSGHLDRPFKDVTEGMKT